MANRYSKRIGRVVRLWDRIQPQQHLHHLCDLRLFRAAVTDDRTLDLRGRVFDNRHPSLDRGEHRDTSRVPKLQGAARIDRVKDALDGDALGAVLGKERR